jgi:hypothetical protein
LVVRRGSVVVRGAASVADPWWVRGRSVVGTDVPEGRREDDEPTIRPHGKHESLGRNSRRVEVEKENPMYQITTAMVEQHQSDLRADAKRWHLSRVARAARNGARSTRTR